MSKLSSFKKGNNIVLVATVLNFPTLFEAKSIDGNDPKYSTVIMIDKEDTDTIKLINDEIEALKSDPAFTGVKTINTPLKDGDEERSEYKEFNGKYYLNASTKYKPDVIDVKGAKISDFEADKIYSGVIAHVSINLYKYKYMGKAGISAGLNAVMKYKDGERIVGEVNSSNDFASLIDKDGNDFSDLI